MPTFSIIIPTYNSKNYIMELLDFLTKRVNLELCEIIVIDDGSVDGTFLALQEMYKHFVGIRLLYQSNRGAGAARNLGISSATGDYLWFIDADDSIKESSFITLFKVIQDCQSPDIITFSGSCEHPLSDSCHVPNQVRERKLSDRIFSGEDYLYSILQVNNFIVQPGHIIIRRKLCMYFPVGMIYEDNIFFIQNILRATRVVQINDQLYLRKLQIGSVMNSTALTRKSDSMIKLIDLVSELQFPGSNKGNFIKKRVSQMFMSDYMYLLVLRNFMVAKRLKILIDLCTRLHVVPSVRLLILSCIPIFLFRVWKK